MRFLAGEEGIGEDGSAEVTREDVLDLAGDAQLGRCDDRQLSPLASKVVARPERPPVGAHSLRLYICTQFSGLLAPVGLSFHDVVIALASDDLAPEPQLLSAALEG